MRSFVIAAMAAVLMAAAPAPAYIDAGTWDIPAEQSQQPQKPQPNQEQFNPYNRGTEQAPVVVKSIPEQKTSEEAKAEQEKAELDRKAVQLTADLAKYTLLLFVTTAGLTFVTGALAVAAFRQIGEGKRGAVAAEDAAKTAARQLELSHRPWIPPNVVPAGVIAFGDEKMTIPLIIAAHNIGSSPAFNVSVKCEGGIVPLNNEKYEHRDDPTAQSQLKVADSHLEEVKTRIAKNISGTTLFPKEHIPQPIVATIAMEDVRKEMQAPTSRAGIACAVFGSIVYQSIAGDFYESGFALIAVQARENKTPGATPLGYYGIDPTEGNVEAGYWILTRHPGASGRTT